MMATEGFDEDIMFALFRSGYALLLSMILIIIHGARRNLAHGKAISLLNLSYPNAKPAIGRQAPPSPNT